MDREVTISRAEKRAVEGGDAPRPSLLTRLKIISTLSVIGGLCGAGAGIVLTYLGNLISGYPIPPSAGIYAFNVRVMAAIGAIIGPSVAWNLLREVPLWRVLLEPGAAGVATGVLSMLLFPSAFGAVVPLAMVLAAGRLRWEYRIVPGHTLNSGHSLNEAPNSPTRPGNLT